MAQRSLNDVSGVIAAMLFIFFDSLSASPNQSNGTTLVKLCVGSNGLMLFKIVATMALRDKMAATVCQWWCGSGDEWRFGSDGVYWGKFCFWTIDRVRPVFIPLLLIFRFSFFFLRPARLWTRKDPKRTAVRYRCRSATRWQRRYANGGVAVAVAMNDILAVTVFIEVSFLFERWTGSDQFVFIPIKMPLSCFSFFVFLSTSG